MEDGEGVGNDGEGDWCGSDFFSVGEGGHGLVGVDGDFGCLECCDFWVVDVGSFEDLWEGEQEFELGDVADEDDGKLAVGDVGVRSDFHTASIHFGVCYGAEHEFSLVGDWLFVCGVVRDVFGGDVDVDAFESGESLECCDNVGGGSFESLESVIDAGGNFGIISTTCDVEEVATVFDFAEVDGFCRAMKKGLDGESEVGVDSYCSGEVIACSHREDAEGCIGSY